MLAQAGWDEAVEAVQTREKRRRRQPAADEGVPVFGMPGVRMPRR